MHRFLFNASFEQRQVAHSMFLVLHNKPYIYGAQSINKETDKGILSPIIRPNDSHAQG